MSDDGKHLDYEIDIEDLAYLTAPVTYRTQWDYPPEQVPANAPCDPAAARRFLEQEKGAPMNSSATELIKSASSMKRILAAISCCALLPTVLAQTARETAAPTTQIVLLGTGTPTPDPDRSGPATAIVVNGTPYLIDFGPGVVRRIAAAAQRGVQGLSVVDVKVAFLTHLHSDHTAGFPDLILTPWAVGRTQPLEVYGPKGLGRMTRHILEAYADDITIRRRDKESRGEIDQAGAFRVNAHEIRPGVVYEDVNVKVTAFLSEAWRCAGCIWLSLRHTRSHHRHLRRHGSESKRCRPLQ